MPNTQRAVAAVRLSKTPGLRTRREFLRAQQGGQRFKSRHMILLLCANEAQEARVGFTTSRRLGGAVRRNRVRRRLREILRTHPSALSPGYDHVVIAFAPAVQASFATLKEELLWLLNRATAWASGKRC